MGLFGLFLKKKRKKEYLNEIARSIIRLIRVKIPIEVYNVNFMSDTQTNQSYVTRLRSIVVCITPRTNKIRQSFKTSSNKFCGTKAILGL